jgi:hypothetical protein
LNANQSLAPFGLSIIVVETEKWIRQKLTSATTPSRRRWRWIERSGRQSTPVGV